MELDFGKRKVGGELPSAFHPWQPSSSKKDLGIAEASNSTIEPCLQLQLALPNNNAAEHNNDMNVDNSTPVKNSVIDGRDTISGVGNDAKAAQTDEIQDMDSKLKRMLANRAYSLKYRLKKNKYIAGLEGEAKSYENMIATLQPQLEAYKNRKEFLLIEQHNLKLQMAACEKERILKEAEIENNKAKVNKLSELHRVHLVEGAKMLSVGAPMQLMSNSNSNSSGGLIFSSNSNQAQNGVETSRVQTGTGHNMNIVKSEPVDQ